MPFETMLPSSSGSKHFQQPITKHVVFFRARELTVKSRSSSGLSLRSVADFRRFQEALSDLALNISTTISGYSGFVKSANQLFEL
jgi:hypothetical protein